jgi:cytosine/adenosine deaminase-related metal-dependent hydrolase
MERIGGTILTSDGFVEGILTLDEGMVIEIEEASRDRDIPDGIILPTLINAHTHIADLRVPVDLSLSLEELVSPPDGLKHRMLRSMEREELSSVFREASDLMFTRGVSTFVDFRESGVFGSRTMRETEYEGASPVIMGRPESLRFDEEEMDLLLDQVAGVGVSSVTDWDYGDLEEIASMTRSRGKMFALHASERIREDIDLIVDLEPDFLVHMTMATDHDLEVCSDLEIPVVVCPRSNLFFGRTPPLSRMLEKGVTIALGTDNAMISLPDMLTEMEFAGRLIRQQGIDDLSPVLDMAVANGRKFLNLNETIGIQPGSPCDFMVLGPRRGDAIIDLVLRSSTNGPLLVCKGERIWREPGCAYSRRS